MEALCTASGRKIRLYGEAEVVLTHSRYASNGRVMLTLTEVEDLMESEPHAVCTVNLPHVPLRDNEVIIKTWGRNVGMLGWLIDHRIVSHPLRYASFGGIYLPICVLLEKEED